MTPARKKQLANALDYEAGRLYGLRTMEEFWTHAEVLALTKAQRSSKRRRRS